MPPGIITNSATVHWLRIYCCSRPN